MTSSFRHCSYIADFFFFFFFFLQILTLSDRTSRCKLLSVLTFSKRSEMKGVTKPYVIGKRVKMTFTKRPAGLIKM